MKTLWLLSFVVITAFISIPNAQAHHGNKHVGFNKRLGAAHHFPNQLRAATLWRVNNAHINLGANPKALRRHGWHPSIVAVVSHPQFLNYAYDLPRFRSKGSRQGFTQARWSNSDQWNRKNVRTSSRNRNNQRNYCR